MLFPAIFVATEPGAIPFTRIPVPAMPRFADAERTSPTAACLEIVYAGEPTPPVMDARDVYVSASESPTLTIILPPGLGFPSDVFIMPRAAHWTELNAPTTLTSRRWFRPPTVVEGRVWKSTIPAFAN